MFLPSLPAEWQAITLDQLLSHTGGVPDHFAIFRNNLEVPFDWTRDYTASELVGAFLELDDDLVAAPGTQFLYSSTDYAAFCSPTLPDKRERPSRQMREIGTTALG